MISDKKNKSNKDRLIILFANTDWYLYNFRRSLALAAKEAGYEVLLISPDGPYGEKLRALGLRWQSFSMDRLSLNPLSEISVMWRLWRLFRREQPDLVHGFTIKCAIYGAFAARIAKVPARVSAVAGMGYVFTSNALKAKALRPVVRWLLKLALGGENSRLILQNPDDMAEFTRAHVVENNCIRLIRSSGADCVRFHPPKEKLPERPFRILLAARLLWPKGLAEYSEAAQKIKKTGRAIDFLLAGASDPGNPSAVSESLVRSWEDEGLLRWLGHVEDMPALYRSVHAVVLPSFYGEGVPKSLIEAGASGCALITTQVPGCREVVEYDGVDGLKIFARNSASIESAIVRLYDDPHLCEYLGRAARKKVLESFDERVVIDRTVAVYDELLGCS